MGKPPSVDLDLAAIRRLGPEDGLEGLRPSGPEQADEPQDLAVPRETSRTRVRQERPCTDMAVSLGTAAAPIWVAAARGAAAAPTLLSRPSMAATSRARGRSAAAALSTIRPSRSTVSRSQSR
jgi:hypothetical protein